MRTPGRRVGCVSRKLAGMTTGPDCRSNANESLRGEARPVCCLRDRVAGSEGGVAAKPARITARYVLAIGDGVGGHTDPGACIQREVFGGRVVVMARSDHSYLRAVPVDPGGAVLVAQHPSAAAGLGGGPGPG
jgi:hypothetical protein